MGGRGWVGVGWCACGRAGGCVGSTRVGGERACSRHSLSPHRVTRAPNTRPLPPPLPPQAESKVTLVYGQMNEPPGARARVALTGLTVAEYFRDEEGQDVLLFVDNIFRFTQVCLLSSPVCGHHVCVGVLWVWGGEGGCCLWAPACWGGGPRPRAPRTAPARSPPPPPPPSVCRPTLRCPRCWGASPRPWATSPLWPLVRIQPSLLLGAHGGGGRSALCCCPLTLPPDPPPP